MRSTMVMEVPKGVQRFTIDELVKATNGFGKSNEIGEGGFGKVFVGNFPDGRTFAIKRAAPVNSTSQAGHEQFRNEVIVLLLFTIFFCCNPTQPNLTLLLSIELSF
jgi:hypothetical protein